MKTINSITLNFSLILLPLYAPSVLARANLVVAWNFDEGSGNVARDITGNGHDGEIKDAKWVEGKFKSALEFKGGYAPGMKRWFNGVVDEVMLWDAALSEKEISANMQKSVKEVSAVFPIGKIAISWSAIKSSY